MSDEKLTAELAVDAQDAAYRLAGRQFVKATREPLIAFFAKQLSPEDPQSMGPRIAAFLDTELGEALISGLLAGGIHMLPTSLGAHVPRLAKELRVRAMTEVGDVVADLLMGPLRTVIVDFLVRPSIAPLALPQDAVGREKIEIKIEATQDAKSHV